MPLLADEKEESASREASRQAGIEAIEDTQKTDNLLNSLDPRRIISPDQNQSVPDKMTEPKDEDPAPETYESASLPPNTD